jgi:hypothetical protein
MKHTQITLLASLTVILSFLYLYLAHNQAPAVDLETRLISESVTQTVLEATIQIHLFPNDALDALGVGQGRLSLNEALSIAEVEYRHEIGLGTLVNHYGEIMLVTHDHWGCLDNLGAVLFRNAVGDPLLELDGDTFKDQIRYQDGGTMILGRSISGDQSDYLSAMISISKTKYNRRISPTEFGDDEPITKGKTLIIVRQGRKGSKGVDLMQVTVVSIGERWGQLVYKLRCVQGGDIMPGDSGGGLWFKGR